jgi:hypothetical protein
MLVKFRAERVFLDEDTYCTVVTFDTTGREYLNLQRALPPVPDEETGLVPPDEEVYLERLGQACAARGGVEACQLHRTGLRMRVTEATARQLRGASEFDIAFEIGDAEFARLRALLRNLFREVSGYREVEAEPVYGPESQ